MFKPLTTNSENIEINKDRFKSDFKATTCKNKIVLY